MARRTLKQVAETARRYRKRHGTRAHLPEDLREAAAQMARSHAVGTVVHDLGICPTSLRRWMKVYPAVRVTPPRPSATRRKVKAKPRAAAKRIDFVEIKAGQPRQVVQPADPASAVEVTRPDGSTVRVTGELAKAAFAAMLGEIQPLRRKP